MTAITDDGLTPDAAVSPDDKPNVHDSMAAARLAGYSWDAINGHLDQATDQALAAGYSQDEIDSHLGQASPTGLGDALRLEGQIALADATRDGADMHALEAASGGAIPAPEQDKAPETTVNPSVAQNYVRALTNREVRGPEDYAQTYAQSIYDAAAEPGIDPFGMMQPHIDAAAKDLAGQLPTFEDATDHAIALVHAAGHEPTPEMVGVAREQMLDRWADTGATLQQTLSQAQDDPWLADTLTRTREFKVPPSLAELEMPKRDEVVDPFNAVGADIYNIADHAGLLNKEVYDQHDQWKKVFDENMKPDAETGAQPTYGQALDRTLQQVGMDPLAPVLALSFAGGGDGKGISARFSSRLLEHLNAAGKDADVEAALHKVYNENADAVAKDQVIQQTLGEIPSRPRNEAEATMRFTRGSADREIAVAKARLDQYQKAVQDALPDHEETIKQVQAAGGFKNYLDNSGKLDDLTIAKLYIENRSRLNLENPFPEEHPLYGFADTMRDIHQGIRDRLEQNPLFDGMGYHEDYYRHMWSDPNQADRVFGAGREGSAASTRAREIPTEMQGIERGLTPKIPDPIANTMQYMQGLLYHEATLNTLAMGRTSGTIKWSPSDTVKPAEGYERLQGRTANTARSWTADGGKAPSRELALWQGEHLPEIETPGTAVATREGGQPATVEAMQAQREGNQKRIDGLKNEIAIQEANHQDVTGLHQELAERQAHDERIAGQIEDLRQAKPETDLNRPTSETLKPEAPPAEAATKLVSFAWAPKGYARAYNSWVGRGFYDHPWMGPLYTGLQYASNMMNGFKLSLSGYHLANIAQETGVAGIARAYGQLPRGDLLRGLGNLGMGAAILPEMGHLWKVGKNFENAYLRTGGNAVDPALVDLFTQAGGRVGGRAAQYRIDGRDNLVSALRSGALHNEVRADARAALGNPNWNPVARAAYATVGIPKMVLEQVARGVDSINAPLFDKIIPRIKQGAWSTEMADFLRQNPTADRATQLSHARRIMDSIDDRFGEMNQDNLFWNRYAKQMMNLLTVSIGWEYGTMRAFGHAGFDIATGNWNSTRARWLPSFLSMTALQNGVSQYLHTNTLPNNATNWMLGGKTGGRNPDGTPQISAWPSYGKEIINGVQMALRTHDAMGALQNIGGYISGKENSFWQAVKMASTGKDWDDVSLRTKWEVIHHNPPNVFQSLYQILKSATLPISLQQLGERKAGSHISIPEQLLGERPLGKQISNPEGYQKAMDYLHAKDKQDEAKRELKAEQQLESPDADRIDALQQTLMEVKQQLAQGGGGGNRGPSLAGLRRVDAPSGSDAAAPRTRSASVAPAPAGTTYAGTSYGGGTSRSSVNRATARAPSNRSASRNRTLAARAIAARRR